MLPGLLPKKVYGSVGLNPGSSWGISSAKQDDPSSILGVYIECETVDSKGELVESEKPHFFHLFILRHQLLRLFRHALANVSLDVVIKKEWNEWGPPISCLIPASNFPNCPLTSLSGSRFVGIRGPNSGGPWDKEGDGELLYMLDFNQRAIQRGARGELRCTPSQSTF